MHPTEVNQERIVEAGGLSSLLMLLRRYEDETVRRVAAGAIANLAMNGNSWIFFFLPLLKIFAVWGFSMGWAFVQGSAWLPLFFVFVALAFVQKPIKNS